MAFVSSYGEVEEGKKGATRARAAAAEPSHGVACVRACLVLSCLVEMTHEDQTRRDMAHAW